MPETTKEKLDAGGLRERVARCQDRLLFLRTMADKFAFHTVELDKHDDLWFGLKANYDEILDQLTIIDVGLEELDKEA